MSDDTRPTPATGIPAAVATTSAAQGESMDDATEQRLLAAINQGRDEAREREKKADARFERIEAEIHDIVSETRTNTKNIGEQADALTRIAGGAARAVDIALDAKRQATNASDDATKIVQSALTIHGTAIAVTVDSAVSKVVQPLISKVEGLERAKEDTVRTLQAQDVALGELKKSDEATTITLGHQNDTLKIHGDQITAVDTKLEGVATSVKSVVENMGTIAAGVSKLVRWQDQWWVKALLGAAILAGALYYGYEKASHEVPPPAPTVIVAPALTAPTPSH